VSRNLGGIVDGRWKRMRMKRRRKSECREFCDIWEDASRQ
jgi:hypothetical protein